MMIFRFLPVVFFFSVRFCWAQAQLVDYDKFILTDITTEAETKLNVKEGERLIVLAFLSPECPLCQNYTVQLKKIVSDYQSDVSLYGIFPGKAYNNADLLEFKEKYNLPFPLLIDEQFSLTNNLDVKVTPSVVLLTDKHRIVYAGAIDDWAVSLGQKRQVITKNYLVDAINENLHGRPVSLAKTEAIGCMINRY